MRRLRQWSRAVRILLLFALGLLAVAVLSPGRRGFLLPERSVQRLRDRVQVTWYRSLLYVLNVNVTRSGSPCAAAPLWVSNHISWLDIVVLGAQCPLVFVAKSEVGDWPVIGRLAQGTGTLLVRRGDARSSGHVADSMTWILRQGHCVALFPEGTSTNGESVARFHSRLLVPAIRVAVPIQPIAIAYSGSSRSSVPFVGDDEFIPHLWRLLGEDSIQAELNFCVPIETGQSTRDTVADMSRDRILAALGRDPNSSQEPTLACRHA